VQHLPLMLFSNMLADMAFHRYWSQMEDRNMSMKSFLHF
jgi:hypothetical protein